MTILILGAAGNLGTAFCNFLSNKEELVVIAWDKTEIDVTDKGILSKKIIDVKPDIIINLVAFNEVEACEKNKKFQTLARRLNVELVKNLALISLSVKATLIHYSSDYVFKGDVNGYREDDEPAPINFYGQTKFDGEKELLKLTGKGLKWYLIRTARLFGPQGVSPNSKINFFSLVLNLIKSEQNLKVNTNEISSFTYTPDLAKASFDLVLENCPFGTYHLVNSGSASWYDGAKYFLEKKGLTIDIEPIKGQASSRLAKRPQCSLLLNTKRPALRSWQEAVDDYVRN